MSARAASLAAPFEVARYDRRGYALEVLRRPDGFTALLCHAPHLHSALVAAYFRAGSRYEPPAKAGISHFLEHIVFKGTAEHAEALDIAVAAEALGGSLEAETHFEYTTFWIHPHPARAAEAVDLVRAVTTAPRIRAADVARERRVVLQECRDYRDAVEGDRALARVLWPKSRTTLHPLGGAATVRRLTREDLVAWHRRTYLPASTVVVCAGAFDPDPLRRAFARWPSACAPSDPPSGRLGPVARGGRLLFRGGDDDRIEIRIFHPAPSYSDPRDVPLWVLGEILGGGPTSRLFLDLREDRGLAYEAVTSYWLFRGVGFLECRASVHPADGPLALERMLVQAADLARAGPSAEELERFRTVVATRMESNLDRPEELASWFGLRMLLVPERLEFIDEEADRVAAVTPGAVRDLAREIFRPSRRIGVVFGRVRPRTRRAMERVWSSI